MEALAFFFWWLVYTWGGLLAFIAVLQIFVLHSTRKIRERWLRLLEPGIQRAGLELNTFKCGGTGCHSTLTFRRKDSREPGDALRVSIEMNQAQRLLNEVTAYIISKGSATPDFRAPVPKVAALDDVLRELAVWIGQLDPKLLKNEVHWRAVVRPSVKR